MFTVLEVAERLNSTDDHILDLIHSNRLRAVNIGMGLRRPRWRIPQEALDAFLESRTPAAPAPKTRRRKSDPCPQYV